MASEHDHDVGDAAAADELRAHHAVMIGELDRLTSELLPLAEVMAGAHEHVHGHHEHHDGGHHSH